MLLKAKKALQGDPDKGSWGGTGSEERPGRPLRLIRSLQRGKDNEYQMAAGKGRKREGKVKSDRKSWAEKKHPEQRKAPSAKIGQKAYGKGILRLKDGNGGPSRGREKIRPRSWCSPKGLGKRGKKGIRSGEQQAVLGHVVRRH